MTKVKRKALPHGTAFTQELPGLCCVQDAGLCSSSNGALSCPPRSEGLPHSLGSVWVQSGAGGVGEGVWGLLMPWDKQAVPPSCSREAGSCCRIWGSKETTEVTGQWALELKKDYKRLETFEISSDHCPYVVGCIHTDLTHWQRTPKETGLWLAWVAAPLCPHLLPPPLTARAFPGQHFGSGALLFSSPEKCLAALPQVFNWELSAAT